MTVVVNQFDHHIDALREKAQDLFSRQIIEGAVQALQSQDNPLRLTFFATAMRILFEHLMDTRAPVEEVERCAWLEMQTKNGRPTRRQRITYAIQGGLTDKFVQQTLKVDPAPLKKTLLDTINALSKHIHERETTIITERPAQDEFVEATLSEMNVFLDAMKTCRDAVLSPVAEELDDTAVEALLSETILQVDELATHHWVEEIYVVDTTVHLIGPDTVTFRVIGSISVTLQWGSNSDFRRGDGAQMPKSFPFWCDLVLPIKTPWDISSAEMEYSVDTSDWYSNRYDEEPP